VAIGAKPQTLLSMNYNNALGMIPEIMNYPQILGSLKEKIRQAQLRAVLSVNTELLGIYWEIGRTITMQEAEAGWGAKIVDRLAVDLRSEFPDMKGFSQRNLRYMREFYQAYPFPILQPPVAKLEMSEKISEDVENQYYTILQPLVAKLPWSHHVLILTKARLADERLFYVQKCIENGWSKSVLEIQIDNRLHIRQGRSLNNFMDTLPAQQSDLANATFKNPYVFDFLSLGEKMQERDMEKALIQHLKKFMLELGKGFAYVGNQYRLQVDGNEFILDLLFYNIPLHAYVLFELKLIEFQPEFAGKLNFYINAVDAQLRGPNDKPTIGVLLCKTPNSTVVKYALQGMGTPIGISEIQLAEALPQQLRGEMPSIADLEAEMDKEYNELKKPIDQKLDRVKAMMRSLQQQTAQEIQSPENTSRIFEEVLLPIKDGMIAALEEIASEFRETGSILWVDDRCCQSSEEARTQLETQKTASEFKIEIRLKGCKPAGARAFDISKELSIKMEDYAYRLDLVLGAAPRALAENRYHDSPSSKDLKDCIDKFTEVILDEIAAKLAELVNGSG
jgi:predicted nuclease of restriction endonuclease-like (RecB) superfamily